MSLNEAQRGGSLFAVVVVVGCPLLLLLLLTCQDSLLMTELIAEQLPTAVAALI